MHHYNNYYYYYYCYNYYYYTVTQWLSAPVDNAVLQSDSLINGLPQLINYYNYYN